MTTEPQRILITGANRGIGLELARQYLARGARVIATCRKPQHAADLHALAQAYPPEQLIRLPLDITNSAEINEIASSVELCCDGLDVLFNNAGIFERGETPANLTTEGMLRVFHVNSVAPIMLVQAMLPLLAKGRSPRILNISSQLGSLAGKRSGGNYSYCGSKAALNMLTRALAADLREQGVVVVAVHPGWVQTDMGGRGAAITPQASAQGLIALADRLTPTDSGEFFTWQGEKHPW